MVIGVIMVLAGVIRVIMVCAGGLFVFYCGVCAGVIRVIMVCAQVGGVPCVEINSLEVEFLFMTNFSLFVDTET